MFRPRPTVPLCVATAVLTLGPTFADCAALGSDRCVLVLHDTEQPSVSASCTAEAWKPHLAFQLPDRLADSNADGWWETVLELDLSPAKGCSCAVFRIHFAEPALGFAFNIGDSASNDGYGGDAGTDPRHSAEIQAHTSRGHPTELSVYSSSGGDHGQDRLLALNLPDLDGRFLEIEVCDQFIGFSLDGDHEGPWAGRMAALDSKRLFAIATATREPGADASTMNPRIYAAFNRVIHQRRGAASEGRVGRGVKRVEIALSP